MKHGTYYLNNTGSRWIVFENDKRVTITLSTTSGATITRSVNYWEAFGNFATANISYRGKRVNVFPDSLLPD